jgi:transcriptional antiterminator RfaH
VEYLDTQASSWFVVQTKPRAEHLVLAQLARDPVVPYAPKILVSRRHASRRWQALESLFPGYLFVRFNPQPSLLHRIRRTPGVTRLLWDDQSLVPVDDEIVRFIQLREAGRGFIEPPPAIQPGARVRFESGPFALLEGIVDRPTLRRDRVRVLLTLMGAPVSVDVNSDIVEIC